MLKILVFKNYIPIGDSSILMGGAQANESILDVIL